MTSHIQVRGVSPRIQYVADGTNATFAFPFAIFKNENLSVYLGNTLQLSTSYTITGAGNTNGGSISFGTPPANETIVTLVRTLTVERTSDFQEGSSLRANVLNDELDYQTACIQEVAENLNRSMILPPYSIGTDVNLTLPTPSAGKAIVWNSDGTNLENSTIAVNALESTIAAYKTAAETAAVTATQQSITATQQATTATQQATTATQQATTASVAATTATQQATLATTTVASKANKDMNNLSTVGKKFISASFTPSNSFIDLTLGSSGSNYTAPANGWMIFAKKTTGNQYIGFYNDTSGIFKQDKYHASADLYIFIPVREGDFVRYTYTATGTTTRFRFIYAQGEI